MRCSHRQASWIAQGVALLFGAALCAGSSHAQGVTVALLPNSQTIAPGSEFTVELQVIGSSGLFNAFDAVLGFDPGALTFVPMNPAKQQEGCLMSGLCSSSCGNTSMFVSAGPDSIWVSDGLLCAGIRVSGPGQLYRWRFRAGSLAQVTTLRLKTFAAYNAGLFLLPVVKADATIGIGVTLDAGPATRPGPPQLAASPNPGRGNMTLRIETPEDGEQQVVIHDVLGRQVRVLSNGHHPAGTRKLHWDGRDASGARARPGIYLVTLRTGTRIAYTRIAMIE